MLGTYIVVRREREKKVVCTRRKFRRKTKISGKNANEFFFSTKHASITKTRPIRNILRLIKNIIYI